jgi:DHA1 family multidrug resistance protein-like MFS transporter
VAALALAFGGGLGHLSGGLLLDLATRLAWPALPWLTFAAVGLLTALGLSRLPLPPEAQHR